MQFAICSVANFFSFNTNATFRNDGHNKSGNANVEIASVLPKWGMCVLLLNTKYGSNIITKYGCRV